MQILITNAGTARTRALTLSGWQIGLGLGGALVLVLAASIALYHLIFVTGVREGWPAVSRAVQWVAHDEFAQRDRYMRENLDAMARKLGEMQAKLVQLEAMGDRVSGLAGLKPEDWRQLKAGKQEPGSRTPSEGRGGPFVPAPPAVWPTAVRSPAEFQQLLEAVDAEADRRADVFTLIESRLFEKRLESLMVPSTPPVQGPIGSGFGFRVDPFTGRSALHTGLDFPADSGTPITAAAGGMVVNVQAHPQYGHMVELDHGNGLVTRYGHTSKVLVHQGDLIKRGQPIALVGSTGRSTGPHLHFEVLVDGVQQDPAKFLARGAEGASLTAAVPGATHPGR